MEFDQKYKALSDATRRKILDLLQDKTLTAGEIAEICQSTKPNISQHLNVLKNAGLIQDEKKGLYIYYSLNKSDFIPMNKEVKSMISIKDKILSDIIQIAENKKCEPVSGATDSQDEGKIYIMKDSATILSFDYSFRLSSFIVNYEIPAMIEQTRIDYQDTLAIEEFLHMIEETINTNLKLIEKKQKEKNESIDFLTTFLANKTSGMNLFGCRDQQTIRQLKEWCLEAFEEIESTLPIYEQKILIEEKILEITSIGKIHVLLEDPNVAEIMVNSHDEVIIERRGKKELTAIKFRNEEEVYDLARKIAGNLGRRIDNSMPFLDARLPDGSRITVAIPPMAVKGVCITIRKFFSEKLTMNDLIKFGSITKEAADFLESAVKAKTNIIVSGGGTSGKTTLLNILTNLTEEDDRIFTIEDSVELNINRPHVVKLESRPANSEGRGEVTIRDLIKFANRSRPDRIVAGELRNGAVFDFLQACNSGVNGSMASVHAQSIEVVKKRLINLMQQAGFELPENFYGEMIQDGIDIIVQVTRLKDGTRKVTQISEVVDYDSEGKHIITKPIFEWVMEGMKDGKMLGELHYTGYKLSDNLNDKFDRENIDINKVLSELTEKGDEFPVESQLSDCLLYIADALKSGHAISNAIGMVAKEMEGPLGNEFLETYHLMESGKMFKESLIDMKKRVNHPDFNFFTNALIIQYDTGAPSEPVLRKLVKIMDDNSIIRQSVPFYKKKKVFNGKDWQLIEFVELLSMVVPSCENLGDALLRVCQVLNNEVTKEFQVALDEMNSGRRQRDALKDAAIRINMQEAKSLVSQINQAETFGVSVEKTLIDQGMKLRKLFKLKNKINY